MKIISLLFLILLNAPLHAEEDARCDKSLSTILDCLSQRAPSRLRTQAVAFEGEMLGKAAGERKPIDISIQGLRDESKSTAGDSVQATGLVSLDVAGLRDARQKAANWDANERSLQAELEHQSVLLKGYLALVRIQLLRQEVSLIKETEKSLEQNLIEYRKRPQLSPEQDASRTIIAVALQGIRQQRVLFEQEQHSLVHDLEIQIQETFNPSESNLPKIPVRWVDLKNSQRSEQSLEIRQIQILKSKSEALAHLIQTEKKPLLQMGPSFEWNKISGQEGFRYGLTVQAPLTLLSDFSGTTELATRITQRARTEAVTKLRETMGELDHTKDIYISSTEALKNSEPAEKTWSRIAAINRMFLRGLVSGTSLVEVMRQAMSSMQTQHELTLRAVTAYCKIKVAENKAEECWK